MKLLLKSFSWTKYSDRSFFWEVIHLNFWFVSFSLPNNSEKILIWNKLQKINFLMTTCWSFVHESFIFRNFSYFRTRMHFHLFNLVLFWDGKRYFKNSTTKRKISFQSCVDRLVILAKSILKLSWTLWKDCGIERRFGT